MKKFRTLLFFLFCLIGFAGNTVAQEFNYKVNAMYIYYFTRYINWPETSANESITIGVVGDSDVLHELEAITAKMKSGPPVVIKKIEAADAKKCRLVVVSKSHSHLLKEIEGETRNLPILIVSEKQGLTSKGAAIAIYVDDEDNFKTKFQLSKQNIHSRGLKVSHELAALAEIVN